MSTLKKKIKIKNIRIIFSSKQSMILILQLHIFSYLQNRLPVPPYMLNLLKKVDDDDFSLTTFSI